MYTYCVSGLTLASNIPLPELNSATNFGVDFKFNLLPSAPFSPEKLEWFHQWHVEGVEEEDEKQPWVCFARKDEGYLLRFPSHGDFLISRDVSEILCRPLPDIPEVTLRHLLLDQVIPLVLSRRELLVLHASAVMTERGVIAFAGKSGRGKSTMALAFAKQGHALITDDCLALRIEEGKWMALPSYPGVRLWESSAEELVPGDASTCYVAHYTSKRRIIDADGLEFLTRPEPIGGLFVLGDEQPKICIENLTATRGFMAWAEFAYNLDVRDTNFLREHFEALGKVTATIPAYALHYPREFSSLPAVREAILKHLEEIVNDPQ
jgi:hypothetical protein